MKLQTLKNDLNTNATFESKDFGIGDASVVIEILRNRLYSHPIRTLVQEYICNGRDAIRETGKKNKLVVQVPTAFDSTFSVRDYGVGIDPERISEVFVLYGASTKRASNKQTGGFGIGAKSAWSYTDSFAIITYVDGIERHYVAHVGANSNGRLDLVETRSTDQANGTMIKIAVKPQDIRAFKDAVLRCVYFWDDSEKPEVLGLDDSETLLAKAPSLSFGNIEVSKTFPYYVGASHDMKLIIDGIVYSVDDDMVRNLKNLNNFRENFNWNTCVVVKIPNGIVEVSASREKLADSEKTRQALDALAIKWNMEAQSFLKAKFQGIKTVQEYAIRFNSVDVEFSQAKLELSFGDYKISGSGKTLANPDLFSKFTTTTYGKSKKSGGLSISNSKYIELELMENAIFYNDLDESKVKSRRRLKKVVEAHKGAVILTNQVNIETEKDGFITFKTAKGLSDKQFQAVLKDLGAKPLSSVELPEIVRESRIVNGKRTLAKGCINVHTASYRRDVIEINLDTNTDQYLYASLNYPADVANHLSDFVRNTTGKKICRMSQASLKKVQKDPNFKPLQEYLDSLKLTHKVLVSAMEDMKVNSELISDLSHLEGIKNLNFTKMIKTYARIKQAKKTPLPDLILEKAKKHPVVQGFIKKDKEFQQLVKIKYPLIGAVRIRFSDKAVNQDLTWYINKRA
jgi:hypothetical protein